MRVNPRGGLAKAAKAFDIPNTITTVETESFSGHTYPELLALRGGTVFLDDLFLKGGFEVHVLSAAARLAGGRRAWPRPLGVRFRVA